MLFVLKKSIHPKGIKEAPTNEVQVKVMWALKYLPGIEYLAGAQIMYIESMYEK
jgi:hypothetical protein